MSQYEVKHQADARIKRTCRVKPDPEICKECREDASVYHYSVNCQTCERNNKRFELVRVGIGTSLFGADFAIVRDSDAEYNVELARVRDIKEELHE